MIEKMLDVSQRDPQLEFQPSDFHGDHSPGKGASEMVEIGKHFL